MGERDRPLPWPALRPFRAGGGARPKLSCLARLGRFRRRRWLARIRNDDVPRRGLLSGAAVHRVRPGRERVDGGYGGPDVAPRGCSSKTAPDTRKGGINTNTFGEEGLS